MTAMSNASPASTGIGTATLLRDANATVGRSRLARFAGWCVRELLEALHDSRRLESERVLARYHHLIAEPDNQAK